MSRGERKAMITRDAPELSLSRQCRLLSIGRSSFYYAPRGESPSSLALMRQIDELFMKYPFYGSCPFHLFHRASQRRLGSPARTSF